MYYLKKQWNFFFELCFVNQEEKPLNIKIFLLV